MTKAPRKKVVHIQEREPRNPKHGGSWWLTLECGHFTARSRPRPTFGNNVALAGGNAKVMARYLAPKKLRCMACWGAAFHREEQEKAARRRGTS